jgi:hypothetical protein
MSTILLEGESESTMKLVMELAQKLGLKMKVLSKSDIEDIKLGQMMDNVKTNEFVNEDTILYKLKK